MKKSLLVLVILGTLLLAYAAQAADEPSPTIVGSAKCGMCHKKDATGNQLKVWTDSKHAHAFEVLKGEAAIAIAKEKGLGNPWEADACLKCHTTQHFLGAELDAKTKYDIAEGVGCEACHGAGSDYQKMSTMKDHEKALAAGLIVPNKDTCVKCHNADSPTFKEFDYDVAWKQIAHMIPKSE